MGRITRKGSSKISSLPVEHRDDELHPCHALRELLDLLVPPVLNAEMMNHTFSRTIMFLRREKSLEAGGEEDGLLAHLHLFIEAALLGR